MDLRRYREDYTRLRFPFKYPPGREFHPTVEATFYACAPVSVNTQLTVVEENSSEATSVIQHVRNVCELVWVSRLSTSEDGGAVGHASFGPRSARATRVLRTRGSYA